jgi:hypothetical protein
MWLLESGRRTAAEAWKKFGVTVYFGIFTHRKDHHNTTLLWWSMDEWRFDFNHSLLPKSIVPKAALLSPDYTTNPAPF